MYWTNVIWLMLEKCEEFNVTNGHVWSTGESVFNTSVEITCQPGYRLLGQGTRMCRDEGIWSGQVPTCMGEDNCNHSE